MRLALVPLDDRPVNTDLVRDIASIAGSTVVLPPSESLPCYRERADIDAIGSWLLDACESNLDAAVVSLDMLGYGGLIASRTSHDSLRDVLGRVAVLEQIHDKHSRLSLGALNVFLRASDSNNASEEPEYWSEHGRRLHALGGRVHAAWVEQLGAGPVTVPDNHIPVRVRRDFALRRLRNHAVNLAGLELLHSGVIQSLLVTADDTAPLSAGSAEQLWVDYWRTLLGPHENLLVYPGADEVAAVMTARMLGQHHRTTVSYAVSCVEAEGMARIAPFENAPLKTTATRQIAAAGGVVNPRDPDIQLIVHAPAPEGGDFYGSPPTATDPSLIAATVEAVAASMATGQRVALADCRYPNGGDPSLVRALRDAGLLLQLVAYGGWNTAGNTLGSTIAAAAATVIGERSGTLRQEAQQRFLLSRLVEDYGYQSVVRSQLMRRDHGYDEVALSGSGGDTAATWVQARLGDILSDLTAGQPLTWRVASVDFPWARPFEISLQIDPTTSHAPNR